MKISRRIGTAVVAAIGIASLGTPALAGTPGDLGDGNGDGLADVWATIPDGRYSAASNANGKTEFWVKKAGQNYLVPGRDPLRSDMGLGAADAMVALPDVTGDKKADAMVRFGAHLYLYRNDGTGRLVRAFEIGRGWDAMDTVIFAGQLNGDGTNYLLGRSSADRGLYAYKLLANGKVSGVGKVGRNWDGMRFLLAPGQMVGDRKTDLVGIDKSGTLWCYRGTGLGKVSSVGQCGHGRDGFQSAFITGDMTGDGQWDLVGVRYVTYPNGHCGTTGNICDPTIPAGKTLGDIPTKDRAPMYLYANKGGAKWGAATMIGHDMFQFKVMA